MAKKSKNSALRSFRKEVRPPQAPIPLFFALSRLTSWRNRKREEEEDLTFPDEIDTPDNVSARVRFQRYRGLRSLRTSHWDPYENLPRNYARIFQFEDFKRTERNVRRRAAEEAGVVEVCTRLFGGDLMFMAH